MPARTLYRALLACYPAAFRHEYGRQMQLAFDEQLRHASGATRASLWLDAALDAFTIAPKEHANMIGQDIRYAFRSMASSPQFAAAAILSLALAIGANTALYGLWDGVINAWLPVRDPGQLVIFTDPAAQGVATGVRTGERMLMTHAEFEQIRDHATTLAISMAVESDLSPRQALIDSSTQEVKMRMVSPEYFDTFGIRPAIGRFFTPGDNSAGAVLSDTYWRTRFGARAEVLGKSITIRKAVLNIGGERTSRHRHASEYWGMITFIARHSPIVPIALAALFGLNAGAQEVGHLHHVHMNVTDIGRTTEFYHRLFGVVPIQYNGKVPALLMERSFLFLNKKEAGTIGNHQRTGLTHFSWSAADGNHEYQWLKSQGVEFYTPVTELGPGTTYMYLYGPDKEVIELFDSQRHYRFNHIHILAKDPAETAEWFHSLIHAEKAIITGPIGGKNLEIDDVSFSIHFIGARFTPRENDGTLLPTDNTHLDHIAFSFRDLNAAYKRIKKQGVEIVRPMSIDKEYGFHHFFVRAPNGILVELVEAKPWPEAAWEH